MSMGESVKDQGDRYDREWRTKDGNLESEDEGQAKLRETKNGYDREWGDQGGMQEDSGGPRMSNVEGVRTKVMGMLESGG